MNPVNRKIDKFGLHTDVQFHVLPQFSLERSHNTGADDDAHDDAHDDADDDDDAHIDEKGGGVAIFLPHGSALIEAAKYEKHSVTGVR